MQMNNAAQPDANGWKSRAAAPSRGAGEEEEEGKGHRKKEREHNYPASPAFARILPAPIPAVHFFGVSK